SEMATATARGTQLARSIPTTSAGHAGTALPAVPLPKKNWTRRPISSPRQKTSCLQTLESYFRPAVLKNNPGRAKSCSKKIGRVVQLPRRVKKRRDYCDLNAISTAAFSKIIRTAAETGKDVFGHVAVIAKADHKPRSAFHQLLEQLVVIRLSIDHVNRLC